MKQISWMVAGLLGLVLSGCAGAGGVGAAPAKGASETPADWTSPQPTSASAGEAAPSSTPSGYGDEVQSSQQEGATDSGARAAKRRPGLGTVWGEDRQSHVTTTAFFRTDPGRPFATATLHYNDAQGVQAMATASGRADYFDSVAPVAGGQLDVRVLDESLRPLPGTQAGGRTYVVGEAGQRYVLRVENHTGNRVEVVATVDGLDVIDGRPGSFRNRGYILNPWTTLDIEGFRRSDSTVAAFRFGAVEDAYAERKGQGRNVGVIGVAFFDEQGSRWPWTDEAVRYRHDADPFPGRYAEPPPTW